MIYLNRLKKIAKKFKSAIKRIIQYDLEYFDEQFMYGHREILLAISRLTYPDLPKNSILLAGVQHGWLSESGVWKLRYKNFQSAKRLVWHKRWQLAERNFKNNLAIGAPWLHLLKLLEIDKTQLISRVNRISQRNKKVLIFPGHSGLHYAKDFQRQAKYFASLNNCEGATVCLFWLDFCNPEIRQAFEELGFQTVCAGYASERGIGAYATEGGRNLFLLNLLDIFLEYDVIVTDEISSGTFYAASLGLGIRYVPNDISEEFTSRVSLGVTSLNSGFYKTSQEWVKYEFPPLLNAKINPIHFVDFAWQELGESSLLESKTLGSLNWTTQNIDPSIQGEFESEILKRKAYLKDFLF